MRIIAGKKRGLKLLSPTTDVSRPITDRVKESLFSVLYKYGMPDGRIVADLFAGVGSLGLEALSRNARFVRFVEKDAKIAAVLERNIAKAGFVEESRVVKANAFITAVCTGGQLCELVFVDPPYVLSEDVGTDSALGRLLDDLPRQLTDDGIVVVRTQKRTKLLDQYGRLKVIEKRSWGTMNVSLFGPCK